MDELRDGNPASLPFAQAGGRDVNLSRAHQRYDVYLNNEFIGYKTVLKQVEPVDEVVSSYLRRNGIEDFTAVLSNLHYKIQSDSPETAHAIRHLLVPFMDAH